MTPMETHGGGNSRAFSAFPSTHSIVWAANTPELKYANSLWLRNTVRAMCVHIAVFAYEKCRKHESKCLRQCKSNVLYISLTTALNNRLDGHKR